MACPSCVKLVRRLRGYEAAEKGLVEALENIGACTPDRMDKAIAENALTAHRIFRETSRIEKK